MRTSVSASQRRCHILDIIKFCKLLEFVKFYWYLAQELARFLVHHLSEDPPTHLLLLENWERKFDN